MTIPNFLFADNAASTLAVPIGTGDTTIVLSAGGGAQFPQPTNPGDQFTLTLNDALSGLVIEIVYATARSTDTLTVVRAQEGTAASSWLAGDSAQNRVTAGTLRAFSQTAVAPPTPVYVVAGGSANALTATPSPAPAAYFVGYPIMVRATATNTGAATINVSGLGVVPIHDQAGAALLGGEVVSGRDQLMYYTADNAFRIVGTPPLSSFIYALPGRGTLLASDLLPVSDGATNYQATVAQVVGAAKTLDWNLITSQNVTGASSVTVTAATIGSQYQDVLILLTGFAQPGAGTVAVNGVLISNDNDYGTAAAYDVVAQYLGWGFNYGFILSSGALVALANNTGGSRTDSLLTEGGLALSGVYRCDTLRPNVVITPGAAFNGYSGSTPTLNLYAR